MKNIIYILMLFLVAGCSGLKPIHFEEGRQVIYKTPIVYTNSVQVVHPSQEIQVTADIPIVLGNTNGVNVKDIVIKPVTINVKIPSYTNNIEIFGIIKEKSVLTSQSLFVYYSILGILILLGWYFWTKRRKNKDCNLNKTNKKKN